MAVPIKVLRDTTGDTNGLAEFEDSEFITIEDGGTGAITKEDAKSNLEAANDVGDETKIFKVKAGTTGKEAVNYEQIDDDTTIGTY